MKILNVLRSIDPTSGGPMEALRHYGARIRTMGHESEVLSLDEASAPFVSEYPLPVTAIGPSLGGYGYNAQLAGWFERNLCRFDAIIVHGLWQYHAFGTWRALRGSSVPYFVFPHGMLDPWFKTRYPWKHLKKCLYWPWADYRLLRDARVVLFTSEEERRAAHESFGKYRAREAVVDFGTSDPPSDEGELSATFLAKFPQLRDRRLLLFLGRIHEKKGVDLLIDALARVASLDAELHLVIAGPDQTNWMPSLQAKATRLGIEQRVVFPGMLQGQLKWGAFYASDAFVLPSHQENFGVAVAEALGCGLPVLISDKVNIWREVQSDGAGLVGSDTVDGTEHNLRRWLSLDSFARDSMRKAARACFERRFTADATARSLLAVLQEHVR
jgi:glycosyltransferase involved in cell wall biosynthesis